MNKSVMWPSGRWASVNALIVVSCALCWLNGATHARSEELSCRDEQGNAVDWFIGYKFPLLDGDKQFETGHAYAYITSDDVKATERSLEDDDGELEIDAQVVTRRSGSADVPQQETVADSREPNSSAFLHRFTDLLMKFAGGVSAQPARVAHSMARPKSPKSKRAGKPKSARAAAKPRWVASERLITDPQSAVMRTLAPAYAQTGGDGGGISSLFYNDDPAETDGDDSEEGTSGGKSGNARRAHAKGVLLLDEASNSAVWLTHSVPRFPPTRKQSLEYPSNGRNNGQTLMCVSLDLQKSGNQLVNHLYNMRPLVYDREISASLEKQFPNLQYLNLEETIKGKRLSVQPTLAQTIATRRGQTISLFSKSLHFEGDIWDNWIDDELGADLYVQTWRRGAGGVLPSACPANKHHVNNVNDMKYDSKIQWSYIKDHSKWAISDEESLATVCVGDSNRMASQSKRGGGAVCFRCPACWSVFSNVIQDIESCPRGSEKVGPAKSDRTA